MLETSGYRQQVCSAFVRTRQKVSSMAAKKEADAVAVIKEACMADARRIAGEKGDAEEDLAQAKPFLEEAERAVESIKVPQRTNLRHVFVLEFLARKLYVPCNCLHGPFLLFHEVMRESVWISRALVKAELVILCV